MDAQGTVRRLELKNLHRREGGEEEFGEVERGELYTMIFLKRENNESVRRVERTETKV